MIIDRFRTSTGRSHRSAHFQFSAVRHAQRRVAFLPYVKFALAAAKPTDYPCELNTLGDHLKARRRDLGLLQKEVASQISVVEWTIINWEKNRTTPPVRLWPRIIDFLGYDPHRPPRSTSERIKAIRRNLGVSVKHLADQINVDESTVTRWERGVSTPSSVRWKQIGQLVNNVRA